MTDPMDPTVWPNDAVVATLTTVKDKAFPNAMPVDSLEFFDSLQEFQSWVSRQREFVRTTDYDYSLRIQCYHWDLGPQWRFALDI